MPLPQPDPSLPSNPVPLFSDIDAARGDHLRANNQKIWQNLQYLFDFTGRTTDTLTEGVTNLYFLASRVLATLLSGFSTGANSTIASSDTVLSAFGKAQGQIDNINSRVTSPVAWVPTFTGFGVVTGINAFSWRVGSLLFFEIRWIPGTTTGVQARVSLGFNGVDGNVTTAADYPATLQQVGTGTFNSVSSVAFPLAAPSLGYLTIGMKDAGNAFAPLESRLAGELALSGQAIALQGCVRIAGW